MLYYSTILSSPSRTPPVNPAASDHCRHFPRSPSLHDGLPHPGKTHCLCYHCPPGPCLLYQDPPFRRDSVGSASGTSFAGAFDVPQVGTRCFFFPRHPFSLIGSPVVPPPPQLLFAMPVPVYYEFDTTCSFFHLSRYGYIVARYFLGYFSYHGHTGVWLFPLPRSLVFRALFEQHTPLLFALRLVSLSFFQIGPPDSSAGFSGDRRLSAFFRASPSPTFSPLVLTPQFGHCFPPRSNGVRVSARHQTPFFPF